MDHRIRAAAAAILAAALAHPAGARAGDAEGWSFRLTPYVWLPTLSTDLTIGANPPTSSGTDILDVLDVAVLLNGEARRGDWALIGEFNYLSLSRTSSYLGGIANIDSELDGFMAGAALSYRILAHERGRLEVFAGARVWSLEARIGFRSLPRPRARPRWSIPSRGCAGRRTLGRGSSSKGWPTSAASGSAATCSGNWPGAWAGGPPTPWRSRSATAISTSTSRATGC